MLKGLLCEDVIIVFLVPHHIRVSGTCWGLGECVERVEEGVSARTSLGQQAGRRARSKRGHETELGCSGVRLSWWWEGCTGSACEEGAVGVQRPGVFGGTSNSWTWRGQV